MVVMSHDVIGDSDTRPLAYICGACYGFNRLAARPPGWYAVTVGYQPGVYDDAYVAFLSLTSLLMTCFLVRLPQSKSRASAAGSTVVSIPKRRRRNSLIRLRLLQSQGLGSIRSLCPCSFFAKCLECVVNFNPLFSTPCLQMTSSIDYFWNIKRPSE